MHFSEFHSGPRRVLAASALLCVWFAGCTSAREWWHNGFKVGPDYCPPAAPTAEQWIDQQDPHLGDRPADYSDWWTVFNDPLLNELVDAASQENLSLRVAGMRILEARAQRGVAAGNIFPQAQSFSAMYSRSTSSGTTQIGGIPVKFDKAYFQRWSSGFDASWEIDFWGRFRRAVEAADANLDAEIANYDDVMVILQAEVAATYVDIRTLQRRLALAKENVGAQKQTLELVEVLWADGEGEGSPLNVPQATVDLSITRAAIPLLEANYRQAQNRLCVLLGMPPEDIRGLFDERPGIPVTPREAAVGIPAEMLRSRPDVRRAEREVAAQSARIGIAVSDLYPHLSIGGTLGLESVGLSRLFDLQSVAGTVGPSLRWDILNYGRIVNNIDTEDARFRQSVVRYREAVLKAHEEVENALVAYLQDQRRLTPLQEGEEAARKAFDLSRVQFELGAVDFQRVLDSQRMQVREQDRLADGEGSVALRLIAVYKALGGGWRVRCGPHWTRAAAAEVLPEAEPSPFHLENGDSGQVPAAASVRADSPSAALPSTPAVGLQIAPTAVSG